MTKENQTGVENKHFKKEQSVLSAIRAEWLLRSCGQDDRSLNGPKDMALRFIFGPG